VSTEPKADAEDAVWVRTDPGTDGVYRVSIDASNDTSFGLDQASALTYAMSVLDAASRAEYDAAVIRQMTKVGSGGAVHAVALVQQLRADRPEPSPVGPLQLIPGVSAATGDPFLAIHLNGQQVGQWTPGDARGHAVHVLECVLVADLDSAYLRGLQAIGIEEDRARAVVDDLINHRETP
jgi:hypothetical protein